MKILRRLALFLALAFVPLTLVDGFEWRCSFPRSKYFGAYPVTSIDAKGILHLEGTSVCDGLYVMGTLNAECARISCARVDGRAFLCNTVLEEDLLICGKAYLHSSAFKGVTQVVGNVEAYNCKFEDNLQVDSGYVELNACTLQDLYVFADNDPSSCNQLQIIKLAHGTEIKGDIVFESGCGRVFIDRCSSICGALYGGLITYPGD